MSDSRTYLTRMTVFLVALGVGMALGLYDTAFATIGRHLNTLASPDEAVFYTSGKVSNEAAFAYQLFVRAYGTNNLPDCSNMCHESTSVGLAEAIGINQSATSQHLALMRREGLVKSRREGQTIYYQLADRNVTRFFGLLEDMFCKRR